MKKLLSISALLIALLFGAQAQAAGTRPVDMTASGAIVGTQLLWCQTPGTVVDRSCSFTQVAAYINSLVSGDCTANGTGTFTCTKTNGTAFSALATTVPGTGVATFLATPSSANLLAALTGSTGTGANVFGTAPTISSLNATVAATLAYITGSTQCLHVNSSGAISGTGSDCGSGGSTTITAGTTVTSGITSGHFLGASSNLVVDQTAVTSIATSCGATGGPITTTGTVAGVMTSRTVSGTTDTILGGDCGGVVYYSSASSIAVTQPAPTGAFINGFFTTLCTTGAGVATVTPGSGTIGGAGTYAVPGSGTAAAPVCSTYQSDGTNFNVIPQFIVNAALLTAGALPAGRMPALTGDITTSAGAVATTIANNAVTNAKAAQGAANTMKGNWTGSTANEADNTMPSCADTAGNHLNYVTGTGVTCGTSSSGGGGAGGGFVSTYITGGTQYYQPITGLIPGTGAVLTANTTAYCTFGTVSASVTIKALTIRLTTGVAATNVEFAIYSYSGGTLTLVDTSSAQASTASSGTNPQTNLALTTDTLAAGTLYAFCQATSGAITVASYAASTGSSTMAGSATALNVTGTAPIIGRSFPVTYSATPSSTFPGTITYSTGTDILTSAATAPAMAFLVN